MSVEPNIAYFDHPMFHLNHLTLQTLAMKKLEAELLQLLWNDGTGALLFGHSRVGKTWALKYLAPQLKTRWNDLVPNYYVSIPPRDQGTILSVLRNICYSHQIREVSHDRADHLSDRIVHFIADRAEESNCDTALLIVDEFQRLRLPQLEVFAELHDHCLALGITLVVLFVGHDPECWTLVEAIEQPVSAHIYGRFFTEGIEFKGLTSQKEVQHCLSEFDRLHYPEDGPSYAEYFTEPGWKFSSLSRDLWRVYHDEFKVKCHIYSWPMKYFMKSVKILLTDFIPEHGIDAICDDMLFGCINTSHLIPSLTSKMKH
ncbi:MAG: ATP-binding protein [Candidatus Thiodiazotropha sp. (ex Lucinoma kastoroae)]|nr:ATP-binding protein [Candidatus Thiodiazotropha sp. (ex Lucinoma kastoroae)]